MELSGIFVKFVYLERSFATDALDVLQIGFAVICFISKYTDQQLFCHVEFRILDS